MRHSWQVGLALIVALAAVGRGTTASAQGGGAGPAPDGANTGGGLSQPAAGIPSDGELKDADSAPVVPPPPPRTARFNRVTTTQSEVITATPSGAARRATSAAAGSMGQNAQLHPFAVQAARTSRVPKDPRVPEGSSFQDSRPQADPPPTTTRSTTHNYYPTLRRGVGPNANAPVQVRRGRAGVTGGRGTNTMLGGGPGRAGRSAQPGAAGRGQSTRRP